MRKTGLDSFDAVKNLYYNTRSVTLAQVAPPPAPDPPVISPFVPDTPVVPLPAPDPPAAAGASDSCSPKENAPENELLSADECTRIYHLSPEEFSALKLYLENPDKTQKELAELEGVTLRTMQRRLAGIRLKTGKSSLKEVYWLFHEK